VCNFDTVIEVLTAARTVIEVNDDSAVITGETNPLCSELRGTNVLPAEAAYLRVRGFSSGSAGTYALIYVAGVEPCNGSGDGDDVRSCARPLAASNSGNISHPDDEDWYRFVVQSPTTVTLDTIGCSADTVIRMYNETGTLMGSNDDSNSSLCSQLTVQAPTGRYFVEVDGYASSTGAYPLRRS